MRTLILVISLLVLSSYNSHAQTVSAKSAQAQDWNRLTDPKLKLVAMIEYGKNCIRKQQFDEAVRVFVDAAIVSERSSLDSFKTRSLLYAGMSYRYKSMYDSAFYYLRQAEKISNEHDYVPSQAAVQLELFGIYNRLGKTDSADAKIHLLETMIPKLDSNSGEHAKIEMYLGHSNKHKAKYSESLQHYYQALRIFSYLKDSLNIAQTYSSIANIFELLKEDKGLPYRWQAIAMLTLLGRQSELANELLDLGDSYYSLNNLDSAEIIVKQALSIANELKDKTYQSYAYLHLGNIYKLRGQFDKAENYFLRSIGLGEQVELETVLSECYQGLGEMYMAKGQPDKANIYLEKHLSEVERDGNTEEIIEAYANLKENEFKLHHYEKAHEYEKLYNTYKDRAYNESLSRNSAEMESKYENEKKEKEIILLKKDQAIKKTALQKERTIKVSAFALAGLLLVIGFLAVNRFRVVQKARRMIEIEKIRNNIARDLHDDVGSVLSSININSKMALNNTAEEKIVKGQLEKIKEHSGRMMEGMSDIVWAINPMNDSLEKMIIRMKEFAVEILEPMNINFTFDCTGNISETMIDVKRRKELYMIFKEAINNAAKYSSCKNITIHFEATKTHIQLNISDDGKGFDRNLVKSGNGIRNMEQRALVTGASINIFSVLNKGTTLRLDIPVT